MYEIVLKDHMDRFCGQEPSALIANKERNFVVAQFSNAPQEGLSTFVSVGLSRHTLMQEDGPSIRQELLITIANEYLHLDIPAIISAVAGIILDKHLAIPSQQLVKRAKGFFPDRECPNITGVVTSCPIWFSDDFASFECDGVVTVFVELVMLTPNDVNDIQLHGVEPFFDSINNDVVDILDLSR